MSPLDQRSYHYYMHENLFRHVDLEPHRTHLLDGTVPEVFVSSHAADFDRWIHTDGGLDVQLLGIGRNGHIAFNEPSSLSVEEAISLPSRLVDLHHMTAADAAKELGGVDRVIPRGADDGLGPDSSCTIDRGAGHRCPQVQIMALALRGPITAKNPASLLRTAGAKVTWLLDEDAARGLA